MPEDLFTDDQRLLIELDYLRSIMPPGEMADRLGTILTNYRVVTYPDCPDHVRTRIRTQDRW